MESTGGIAPLCRLDPRTGWALTNCIQATIVADRTTRSDALATTVCVLGVRAGLKLVDNTPGCCALVLAAEGTNTLVAAKTRRFEKLERRRGILQAPEVNSR